VASREIFTRPAILRRWVLGAGVACVGRGKLNRMVIAMCFVATPTNGAHEDKGLISR
jgi:hypothetical protein